MIRFSITPDVGKGRERERDRVRERERERESAPFLMTIRFSSAVHSLNIRGDEVEIDEKANDN